MLIKHKRFYFVLPIIFFIHFLIEMSKTKFDVVAFSFERNTVLFCIYIYIIIYQSVFLVKFQVLNPIICCLSVNFCKR